jgi:hypothetical protein
LPRGVTGATKNQHHGRQRASKCRLTGETLRTEMGFSFHPAGCVKRAEEC